MKVDKLGEAECAAIAAGEKITGAILRALEVLGRVDETPTGEKELAYRKVVARNIAAFVCFCPASGRALAGAHPDVDSAGLVEIVCRKVAEIFGFEPAEFVAETRSQGAFAAMKKTVN